MGAMCEKPDETAQSDLVTGKEPQETEAVNMKGKSGNMDQFEGGDNVPANGGPEGEKSPEGEGPQANGKIIY